MLPRAESTKFGGIYAIRHVASDRFYLGSAADFAERWQRHRRDLARKRHHSRYLQRAWDKHGVGAFVWEILEFAEGDEELLRLEQEYLDRLQPWRQDIGFNVSMSATAPMRGRTLSEESRALVSAALKGRTRPDEVKAKISAGNKGRVHSAKSRANMSAAHIGNKPTAEAIAKRLATIEARGSLNGLKRSEEGLINIREGQRRRRERERAEKLAAQQNPPDGQLRLPFAN